jgi:tRNA (guanine-N7-)-methyltransferase
MGKNKSMKYAELSTIPIVFERDDSLKGSWNSNYFKNNHPIALELACGKGDYTRGLAEIFPDKNYIGMDIKGNRLWTAARISNESNLSNVAFIRDQIDLLENYFVPNEISEIWITFPDPFPRIGDAKRRLTSPKFLNIYKKILPANGVVNLKTDSDSLFEYTLEVIEELKLPILDLHKDIYEESVTYKTHNIQTYYEKMHLKDQRTIKYVRFKLQ